MLLCGLKRRCRRRLRPESAALSANVGTLYPKLERPSPEPSGSDTKKGEIVRDAKSGRFLAGSRGAGRPVGSRNVLSKALLDDLAADFRRNGRKALRRLQRKSPLAYLRLPNYWRDRAEELRAIAEHLKDPYAKAMIMGCARDYDLLAERAEERLRSSASYVDFGSPNSNLIRLPTRNGV